jgi:hypothetical protein
LSEEEEAKPFGMLGAAKKRELISLRFPTCDKFKSIHLLLLKIID